MPPRLNKRQQRERDELEALAGPSRLPKHADSETESDDELDLSRQGAARAVGGFAALAGDEDGQDVEQASDQNDSVPTAKSKKSKKKKKKGAGPTENDLPVQSKKSSKPNTKPKEKPKSKAKLKAEEDDFDKALAELSGKSSNAQNPAARKRSTVSHPSFDSFNSLISVSLKHLDPDTELRRFFGSKVITSSSSTPRNSRAQASRSHLARPRPTWPPAHYRAGLSMRALTPEEVGTKGTGVGPDVRERWWTVEASPRYKGTTYEFMQCVMGGDPQLFFSLLSEMPWHADTLLQTAEVYRHREEYSTAADFLSRALFAYERAFAGAFNLTTGIHRLDFDRIENRVFYLGLARNIVDLNRRGTPRTAFEFARLLFALDPHTDPHGALLHLDCLALKAGQASWLLDVWDACTKMRAEVTEEGEARFDVTMMPGWCWARALALFEKEGEADVEHRESTEALKDAILAFPSIAPLLADKVDIAVPSDLLKMDAFKIETGYSPGFPYSADPRGDDLAMSLTHLLSHIYALRSFSLWKPPARSSWFLKTLSSLSPSSFSAKPPFPRARLTTLFATQSNLTDAVYRHVFVIGPLAPEYRRLTAFFPPSVKERLTASIEGDPLVPVTAESAYDDHYFVGASMESRRSTGRTTVDRIAEELQRLFPDAIDRGQFQGLFDAHPEIGARFPGGAIQLAQLARQFPQEVLEAMVGMVGGEGNDGLGLQGVGEAPAPGIMPGGEAMFAEEGGAEVELHPVEGQVPQDVRGEEEREADSDSDDEDSDEPFLPVRIVQNLLGRLWPRGVPADSDSDREEEAAAPSAQDSRADDVD